LQSDNRSVGKVRKYFPLYVWYLLSKFVDFLCQICLNYNILSSQIYLKFLKLDYKHQNLTWWAIGTNICNLLQRFGTDVNSEWILETR
jgi:hypothetical protein